MVLAVVVVTLVLAVMNAYLAVSLRQKFGSIPWAAGTVEGLFIAFALLQLVAPWLDWSRTPIAHSLSGSTYDFLVQSSYFALGIMSCLFVYMVFADFLWIALARWVLPVAWIKPVSLILALLVIGATSASVWAGLRYAGKITVIPVTISLRGLAPAFDGFRIAQISDLHIGPHLKKAFTQKVADQLTALKPDMIVLTGDLGDGRPSALMPDLLPLASLSSPFGKYYVSGNHEYYWNANAWMSAGKELGFEPLVNQSVILERQGSSLVIAGVPDPTSERMRVPPTPDPALAIKDAPVLATKILLSHQPKLVSLASKAGYDIQLSGHTHAGQYFPFTQIIRLFQTYTHGLYDVEGVKLYVNRGLGFWGPPLRSNGAGEITLITLRQADPST